MAGEAFVGIIVLVFAIILIISIKVSEKIGNLFIKIFIAIRNFRLHVKAKYHDLSVMNRDIDANYSPAVLSYLYNLKVEPKKDILATILNLYNKKVMTIEKTENGYNFIPVENVNLSELTPDEEYIYCSFVEDKENIKLFSSQDWEKIVIEEYKKYDFSKDKKAKFNERIFYIISIIISLITTFIVKNKLLSLLFGDKIMSNVFISIGMPTLFFIVITGIAMIVVGISYYAVLNVIELLSKLNSRGKDEIVKWIKFKRFIKEYTLIKERKIEEIVIYEKYIPYAMVLGINKEYNNDEIREFVNHYMKLMHGSTGKYLYTDVFAGFKS